MNELCSEIKTLLFDKRASLVGFADLSGLPAEARDSMKFAVSIAVALDSSVITNIGTGPTKQYYSEYKRANSLLTDLGEYVAGMIRQHGYRAIAKAPTGVGIDPKTHSTVLPHKTVATRAGLGWIGKCALLVTEEYGSAVRINTVLTDAPLETAISVDHSRCGDCMICVNSCPGNAPSGRDWNVNVHRDSFFDAFACAKGATERAIARIGVDDTICGICISVCPWTAKYIERRSSL